MEAKENVRSESKGLYCQSLEMDASTHVLICVHTESFGEHETVPQLCCLAGQSDLTEPLYAGACGLPHSVRRQCPGSVTTH